MKPQLSWKVGGQQGEGIESTGEIFATAMNRKGYYLYGYRHFSSRIKGGHTNNKIRVSTTPVQAIILPFSSISCGRKGVPSYFV